MRKYMRIVLALLVVSVLTFTIVGCDKIADVFDKQPEEQTFNEFGMFNVAGHYLQSLASKNLNSQEAFVFASSFGSGAPAAPAQNAAVPTNIGTQLPEPPELNLSDMSRKYSGVNIQISFWATNEEGTQRIIHNTENLIQGADFNKALLHNELIVNSSIQIPYLFCRENLMNWWNARNEEFAASDLAAIAPFYHIYTYHSAKYDNVDSFILGTHVFSEISASVYGGATCQYIQESETLYNEEGRVTRYQSSLGIFLNDTRGTQKMGRNFEVTFNWIERR